MNESVRRDGQLSVGSGGGTGGGGAVMEGETEGEKERASVLIRGRFVI